MTETSPDDRGDDRGPSSILPVLVRAAAAQDAPAVAELMARAFTTDPWTQGHAHPDGDLEQRLREHYLLLLGEHWIPGQTVDVAEASTPAGPVALGAAVWEGPGSTEAPEGLDARAGRILGLDPQVEEADHRRLMQQRPQPPYWHLSMLTVSPAAQGQRVGSSLLEHGLRRAQGLPVVLEATTPGSRRLYERWGFELVELITDAAGVRQAVMRRALASG